MNKKPDIPLARLDRQTANIPLIAAVVVCLLLLAAAAITAFSEGLIVPGIIAVLGLLAFVAVILVAIAAKRKDAALDDRRIISWSSADPEIQRQSVNVEVRELAKLLGVENDQLSDLLSAYIVAEDLALRKIQQTEDLPLMRHVSIGNVPFDGILVDQDVLICIEVAFLVVPDIREEKIAAILKKIATAKATLYDQKSRLRLRLMMVLVTQLTDDEDEILKEKLLGDTLRSTPVKIDVRFLDFEMLQRVYLGEG